MTTHTRTPNKPTNSVGINNFPDAYEKLQGIKDDMEKAGREFPDDYYAEFVSEFLAMRNDGLLETPKIEHPFNIQRTFTSVSFYAQEKKRFFEKVLPAYGLTLHYLVNTYVLDLPILFVDKVTHTIIEDLKNEESGISNRNLREAIHLKLMFDRMSYKDVKAVMGNKKSFKHLAPYFLDSFSLVTACNGRSNDPGSLLALCTGSYVIPTPIYRSCRINDQTWYAYILVPSDFYHLDFDFKMFNFRLLF